MSIVSYEISSIMICSGKSRGRIEAFRIFLNINGLTERFVSKPLYVKAGAVVLGEHFLVPLYSIK